MIALVTWLKRSMLVYLLVMSFAGVTSASDSLETDVTALAWSPDGRMIAAAKGGIIEIIDASDQALINTLAGNACAVRSLSWSPDSLYLASASCDDTGGQVWDVTTGELLWTAEPAAPRASARWSPDGTQITFTSIGGSISIYDVVKREMLSWTQIAGLVIDWSPDSSKLMRGSAYDADAIIIDVATGEAEWILSGHTDLIPTVDWSPDGKLIATGSNDKTIRIWNASDGHHLWTLQGHTEGVTAVAWSPDSRVLATASADHSVRLWDALTGQLLQTIEASDYLLTVTWNPDGTQIAYGGYNVPLTIETIDLRLPEATPEISLNRPQVVAVAWSPDGTRIVGGGADGFLCIWDEVGNVIRTISGVSGYINSVGWSPDSSRIIAGGADGNARIWNAATGELIAVLEGEGEPMQAVAWSPDGMHIVTGSWPGITALRLWSGVDYSLLKMTTAGPLFDLRWRPDGSMFAQAVTNGYIGLVDNKLEYLLGIPGTATPGRGDDAVMSVSWSSDGSQLISGLAIGVIRLWDISSEPVLVRSFSGHTGSVDAVAFRPVGHHFASASKDNTIRIWDVESGDTVFSFFRPPTDFVASISWSPDGSRLAFGGNQGDIRIVTIFAAFAGG